MNKYDIQYVYIDKEDNVIKMSKRDFEELLDKAYNKGYDAGYIAGKYSYTLTTPAWTYKPTTTEPITTWSTTTNPESIDTQPTHSVYTTNADNIDTGSVTIPLK